MKLTYEVSQHDDGEGFVIHSDGKDIWDLMPEPELRKLEPVLARAVELSHWQNDLDQAETVEEVRDVRYGLYETENLQLTREQIAALHEAIDRKEAALTAEAAKILALQENGLYRYYSTQRPVDIGTFPKPPDNKVVEIKNFDKRVPVEEGTMRAWGYIEYQKPLTEKQADDYELKPAPARLAPQQEKAIPAKTPEKNSVLRNLSSCQAAQRETKPRDAAAPRKSRKPKEETR